MNKYTFLITTIVVCFFIGCSRVETTKPEGFADKIKLNSYHAISPEGVLYRVRYVKNYPEKDLDFWQKAVKIHLEKEGYEFLKQEEIDVTNNKGMLFEWGAPYGHENYIYMTAIMVFGKKIAIAEAAGEFSLYDEYRDALINSLKTVKLN